MTDDVIVDAGAVSLDPPVKEKRVPKPLPNDIVQVMDKIMKDGGGKILDTEIRIPKIIATTITPDQTPFAGAAANPDTIKQLLNLNVSGAVVNDQLVQGPAYQLDKLDVGKYKITHNLGYENICLSIGPLQTMCTLFIKECTPNYFVIEASVDGEPIDMGFVYTLTRVIS